MPSGLDPMAKRLWRRLAPALDAMGVLTTNDGDTLARYCISLARWKRALAVLVRKGETYLVTTTTGDQVPRPRPEVGIAKGLAGELDKLEKCFGLNPSARAGLNVTAIFDPARTATPTGGGRTKTAAPPIEGKDRFFKGPA